MIKKKKKKKKKGQKILGQIIQQHQLNISLTKYYYPHLMNTKKMTSTKQCLIFYTNDEKTKKNSNNKQSYQKNNTMQIIDRKMQQIIEHKFKNYIFYNIITKHTLLK
eukprot:TRINITY_DN36263_c0_g1_i1.p1 TRINITY_DN36263_c0_g1~~TRINITY_DN36263_c0_g1_i1.p1  ORF type:complete len:107 (-),score=1.98 TRINITY_DN36263_c0_g1_i1:3-323(-)